MPDVTRVDLLVTYDDGSQTVCQGMTPGEMRKVAKEMMRLSNLRSMIFGPRS